MQKFEELSPIELKEQYEMPEWIRSSFEGFLLKKPLLEHPDLFIEEEYDNELHIETLLNLNDAAEWQEMIKKRYKYAKDSGINPKEALNPFRANSLSAGLTPMINIIRSQESNVSSSDGESSNYELYKSKKKIMDSMGTEKFQEFAEEIEQIADFVANRKSSREPINHFVTERVYELGEKCYEILSDNE